MAKLIARFYAPGSGTISAGGVDLTGLDEESWLRNVSVVFQDVTLFDDTVMENIRIGRPGATDDEVRAAARAAHCEDFIERMPQGWGTWLGENGARLSGGERQRLSIARALLKDAPIVLLDEATSSLDPENETLVQDAVSRLCAGKTLLVIAIGFARWPVPTTSWCSMADTWWSRGRMIDSWLKGASTRTWCTCRLRPPIGPCRIMIKRDVLFCHGNPTRPFCHAVCPIACF